jgi:hypothetical protein
METVRRNYHAHNNSDVLDAMDRILTGKDGTAQPMNRPSISTTFTTLVEDDHGTQLVFVLNAIKTICRFMIA